MNKRDGGAAFPGTNEPNEQERALGAQSHTHSGMSLRDYFAAKAMQAAISNTAYLESLIRSNAKEVSINGAKKIVAKAAYELADAMLAARSE